MAIKIVGDICIDVNHECECNRLSPEGPFPILLEKGISHHHVGMAGYVVKLVSSLTTKVPIYYYGSWDSAQYKPDVAEMLRGDTMDANLHLKHFPGKATIYKNRYFVEDHMVSRIDKDCYKPLNIEAVQLNLSSNDILINSDYQKGTSLHLNLEEANKVAYSIYDPHMKTKIEHILGYTIITPNQREYEHLTEQAKERGYESILGYLHEKSPLSRNRYVVHTAGAKGIYLEYINVRRQEIHKKYFRPLGICKRKVVDIVGAGDCIVAGLAVALHSGKMVEEAISYAMLIAEIAIMHRGTYVVTHEDIKEHVKPT